MNLHNILSFYFGIIHFNLANFCSISFGGERILRLSESKENVFSLPNVSKMPKGNGTQRKAANQLSRIILLTKIIG